MMKVLLVALGATLASYGSVSVAGTCDPIEYAQLKDSTQRQLAFAYCNAMSSSESNKNMSGVARQTHAQLLEIGAIRDAVVLERRMTEYSNAHIACLKVAGSAFSMLVKKFKAKDVPKCQGSIPL